MVTVLVILGLICLDGYFSLAEMALVSVSKGELSEDNLKDDPRAIKALALIKNPEEFLSTIQVGSTLLELIQGIYGGNMAARGIKWALVHIGFGNDFSDIIALTLGVAIITFISIVFGELVPKSIALQVPLKTALSVAIPLSWFARLAFPFIKIQTFTTRKILALFNIRGDNRRVISEKELRRLMGTAYQQGTIQKEQLWLHQNVFTFNNLSAGRIMKPIRISAQICYDWTASEVEHFIKKNPYSNFPVYQDTKNHIVGILETKNFLLNNHKNWHRCIEEVFSVRADTPIWTIFTDFKKDMKKFAMVMNGERSLGILTMQDIMEAIFGDIPELEDYSSYFYPKTDNLWIAEGFIHLQRIRRRLDLTWLRPYEQTYFTLAEFVEGELGVLNPHNDHFELNGITFTLLTCNDGDPGQISIKLKS